MLCGCVTHCDMRISLYRDTVSEEVLTKTGAAIIGKHRQSLIYLMTQESDCRSFSVGRDRPSELKLGPLGKRIGCERVTFSDCSLLGTDISVHA